MNKEEIKAKLDKKYAEDVNNIFFDIKEDEIILVTSDSYIKNYVIPELIKPITAITGKKVYGKLEIKADSDEETSLFNKLGYVIGDNVALDPSYKRSILVVSNFNEKAVTLIDLLMDWSKDTKQSMLTVWGGTGLGKTHLLHAAGWNAIQDKKNVYLTDSNRFIDEVLQATKDKRLLSLHAKWEKCSLMIFDDLQVLSDKIKKLPTIESELFNIIQRFAQPKKRCVFVCDRNPLNLAFDSRVIYRLAENAVEITKPDKQARIKILNMLLKERNRTIDPSFVDLLASKLTQNVRQLQGAINAIDIRLELGFSIDEEMISAIVLSYTSSTRTKGTDPLEKIANLVMMNMSVERKDLLSKRGRNPARITAIATARIMNPEIEIEKIASFFNTTRKSVYEITARESKSEDVLSIISLLKAEGR